MVSDRSKNLYEEQAELWRSMPISASPSPWRRLGFIPSGSLQDLGFVDDSDDLLLVTLDGRELWHCPTLSRVCVDDDDRIPSWRDLVQLRSPAIGPRADSIVRLAGVHGGGLPSMAADGWSLRLVVISLGESYVVLDDPSAPGKDSETYKLIEGYTIFPFGFSYTGLSFVIGDGMGNIWVYVRETVGPVCGDY